MTLFRSNTLPHQRLDQLLIWTLRLIATVVGAIVVLILSFLVWESFPIFHKVGVLPFFLDASWHPLSGLYNLLPMVVSTVFVVAGAVCLAAPLGILSALFCYFFAPPLFAKGYRYLLELLAGVPGVVYGFWGLVVLVPLINRWHPPGTSLLAGILALAILILPTIALTMDASFAAIPESYIHGAAALGLSKWGTVWGVILPAAYSGLFTSIVLGTGRAIGETMIVLMVCGNIVQFPTSLFDPIRTLPANIALEMAFALGDHRSALFVSGLVLLGVSFVLVLIAEAFADQGIYD